MLSSGFSAVRSCCAATSFGMSSAAIIQRWPALRSGDRLHADRAQHLRFEVGRAGRRAARRSPPWPPAPPCRASPAARRCGNWRSRGCRSAPPPPSRRASVRSRSLLDRLQGMKRRRAAPRSAALGSGPRPCPSYRLPLAAPRSERAILAARRPRHSSATRGSAFSRACAGARISPSAASGESSFWRVEGDRRAARRFRSASDRGRPRSRSSSRSCRSRDGEHERRDQLAGIAAENVGAEDAAALRRRRS